MSSVPEGPHYASLHEAVARAAAGDERSLAGRGQRLAAAAVDVTVPLVLAGAVAVFTPVNPFAAPAPGMVTVTLAGNALLGFALFLLAHGYLLARHGQTIGKRLMGLRIVHRDGGPATLLQLVGLRYGLSWVVAVIPGIGALFVLIDGLLIFRPSRKCLHDSIAETIVVKLPAKLKVNPQGSASPR